MAIILNILGIIVLLGVLYLVSSDKASVNKKLIGKALLIQFLLAFFLVKFPLGRNIVMSVSDFVTNVLSYGKEGLTFVFGPLADGSQGFIFAISVLGNIVFIAALVSALYYLGVINFVVKVIGGAIQKVLGTSNVESFVAVANMFLGQTESPILVSKYLHVMTKSELMLVLISGMGSMSATVLMGYVEMGIPMEYLLIAGALVPLSSIMVSKLLIPETQQEEVVENVVMDRKGGHTNIMSAISEGATNGMQMAFGIGAALIAITGLVALVNGGLGVIGLSLQQILAYLFSPLALLMGLDPSQILTAGELLGTKMVLNEFIAFGDLGTIIKSLDPRTALVMSVSLAGFANISSIGICISGISVFCPERRAEISNIAFKGMLGGFLVSTLSAMIVGLVLLF
ncbi:NupC/NupG family nucleoside CNT transporter [Paraclostridium bifermentans]|uniref:NupC/NupG family nucleoside CNT transporter n=1 Tax=Paraclostridium bifermentans TaxID=1490 RepID=UPI00359C7B84